MDKSRLIAPTAEDKNNLCVYHVYGKKNVRLYTRVYGAARDARVRTQSTRLVARICHMPCVHLCIARDAKRERSRPAVRYSRKSVAIVRLVFLRHFLNSPARTDDIYPPMTLHFAIVYARRRDSRAYGDFSCLNVIS